MQVNQIYELLNDLTEEVTGQSDLVSEDLSNVVDVGTAIFANTTVDNYVKALMNRIGKVIMVNRPYKPPYPNIRRDAWEYGSVLQKLRAAIPEAEENPSWDLQPGQGANQFLFYQPTITQKFWNSKQTYDISMSFTEMQVKESMGSASELRSFIGMIENSINMSKTIKEKALAERAINNFMGCKIHATNGVVHLLADYKTAHPSSTLTSATALYDADFLRFCSVQIMMYRDRLRDASNLYNMGTIPTFTPTEYLHLVLNAEFAKSIEAYMMADTYHEALVAMSGYDTVNFWQGMGDASYSFAKTTAIDITTSDGDEVEQAYIVGIMFDRDAIMLCNEHDRVTSAYNAKQEFINNFYKFDISLFNDTAENGIIFILD